MVLLIENMTNPFLIHDSWDFAATGASVLALSGKTLPYRFQSHGALLSNSSKITLKPLSAYPTTFSNNDSTVGLRSLTKLLRPSC
jgi:hypothetical protein